VAAFLYLNRQAHAILVYLLRASSVQSFSHLLKEFTPNADIRLVHLVEFVLAKHSNCHFHHHQLASYAHNFSFD
jgi:hypothetical protein